MKKDLKKLVLLVSGILFFASSIYLLHVGDIASAILAVGIGYMLTGLGVEGES